ncbi:hypothetical protein BH11VER1_BH11VER1_36540 [soil metagenome]
MKPDWHDLIQRYIAGLTTDAEAEQMQDALRHDDVVARLYLRYMNLDVALEAQASTAAVTRSLLLAPDAPSKPPASRWTRWRSFAVAAGLAIGLFSASLVYGFVANRHFSVLTLLTERFEDAEMVRDHGVPSRKDVWSGDLLAPQGAEKEVKPEEGQRMVKLPPVENRKFSYAFRFVDLTTLPPMREGQTRQLEVTARFHGAAPGMRDRFQIRLAAFAEDITGAREIWVRDHVNEQALLHVVKTAKPDLGDRGWTTVRSMIDVSGGVNVALISLAAGVADSETPNTAHYLDNVQVRLITQEAPLP